MFGKGIVGAGWVGDVEGLVVRLADGFVVDFNCGCDASKVVFESSVSEIPAVMVGEGAMAISTFVSVAAMVIDWVGLSVLSSIELSTSPPPFLITSPHFSVYIKQLWRLLSFMQFVST
jgi:hypothetical protein